MNKVNYLEEAQGWIVAYKSRCHDDKEYGADAAYKMASLYIEFAQAEQLKRLADISEANAKIEEEDRVLRNEKRAKEIEMLEQIHRLQEREKVISEREALIEQREAAILSVEEFVNQLMNSWTKKP